MTIEIITLVLSLVAVLFTGVTSIFAVLAYAKVVGMEKSTHQIQWMPVDESAATGDELTKQMHKAFGYEDEENDSII